MSRMIRDWALAFACIGLAVCLWLLAGLLSVCSPNAGETLANLATVSQGLTVLERGVSQKVSAVDVGAVNETIWNVRDTTANAKAVTAVGREYAQDAHDNRELIEEAGVLLWQHVDNTVGHVDKATLDEQTQQAVIAKKTGDSLDTTNLVLRSLDTTIKGFQPVASHADIALQHVDGITAHGEHIAAHYDHELTAPKRFWQKLKDIGMAMGIWSARHL